MARHKNLDWKLPETLADWTQVNMVLLMDIRDALHDLYRLLNCSNFIGIPRTLRDIERKLTRPRPKRKKSR